MSLIRKDIQGITPYVPGRPIDEVKRQLGLKEVIKLASNENPFGPSPKALAAIRKNLSTLNRYPDSHGFYLKKKLARSLGVQAGNIVLGNGSDELIDIIIKAFVEPEGKILTADITFLEYKIISAVNGRRIVTVPLKYFKYDLDGIKRKIDRETRVVFISNPNNPTGTYVTKLEVEEFLKSIPEDVLVVIDEAYDTFIDVNDFPNSLNYIGQYNVVLLKTFSKAYGLAGLRVGYAVARPEFASIMETVRQPFNVNSLAQIAAIAALDDKKFLKKTRKSILEGKDFLYRVLKEMGIPFVPSTANFILIDAGRDCLSLSKEMLKSGVIVRDMKQYGLDNFVRLSIGTKKENEEFVKVFKKIMGSR